MSQQALADKMRELGFEWAQATVWSVEKGKRPLRVSEAEALAKIFGVALNALTSHTSWYTLWNAIGDVQRTANDLHLAAEMQESAVRKLVINADEMVQDGADSDEVVGRISSLLDFDFVKRPDELVRDRQSPRFAAPGDGPFADLFNSATDDVEY